MYKVECAICRDWKDPVTHEYKTPTAEERRVHYFEDKKLSHGYCPTCYIQVAVNIDKVEVGKLEQIIREVKQHEQHN